MEEINLRNYAYLGDALWELLIRQKTILMTNNAKKLHEITTAKVKGSFQAILLEKELTPILTDEEKEIARRGRNLPIPIGRRSNQNEYRQATAFETLIGWWFQNDKARYDFIISALEKKIFPET